MDDEDIKLEATKQALAQMNADLKLRRGVRFLPKDIDDSIRQKLASGEESVDATSPEGLRALGHKLANGAMYNMAPAVSGALESVKQDWNTRNDKDRPNFADVYRNKRDQVQQHLDDEELMAGKAGTAADVAGTLISPLNDILPKTGNTKGLPLAERMARHAVPGVIAGGVSGLGASRGDLTRPSEISGADPEDTDSNVYKAIKDTAKGAGAGAFINSILGPAAESVPGMVSKAYPAAKSKLSSLLGGSDSYSKLGSGDMSPAEWKAQNPLTIGKGGLPTTPKAASIVDDPTPMPTEPEFKSSVSGGPEQARGQRVVDAKQRALEEFKAQQEAMKARNKPIIPEVSPEAKAEAATISKLRRAGAYEPEGVPKGIAGAVDLENAPIEDRWQDNPALAPLPKLKGMWSRLSGKTGLDRGLPWQERPAGSEKFDAPKHQPTPEEAGVPSELNAESYLTDPKYVPEGIEREMNGKGRALHQKIQSMTESDPRFYKDYILNKDGKYEMSDEAKAQSRGLLSRLEQMSPQELAEFVKFSKSKK